VASQFASAFGLLPSEARWRPCRRDGGSVPVGACAVQAQGDAGNKASCEVVERASERAMTGLRRVEEQE